MSKSVTKDKCSGLSELQLGDAVLDAAEPREDRAEHIVRTTEEARVMRDAPLGGGDGLARQHLGVLYIA